MVKKRVFISFAYDNDHTVNTLLAHKAQFPASHIEVSDSSYQKGLPEKEWEKQAETKIKKSDIVVIIAGPKSLKASGIKKEISIAEKHNIEIVQLKPQETKSTTIPSDGVLSNWTWDTLKNILK